MPISLGAQIEEIEREIRLRKDVYARQIASGKMRQSVADMHVERIAAAKRTLEWLRDHETEIRRHFGWPETTSE